jgi:hypothetical protein
MPASNDSLQFEDCRKALEAALAAPYGIKIQRTTQGQAVNFRQRCYIYRKMMKKLSMQSTSEDDPNFGFSPYDALKISYEGPFVIIKKVEFEPLKIIPLGEEDLEL